jgi:hypothetical protein
MFEDGIKAKDAEGTVKALDLSELLAEALVDNKSVNA